jgi:RNA 2',3'-cyclic 3'-phosphodiesterase
VSVRLFVALEIPAAVRANLSALVDELRKTSAQTGEKGPKWVRAENLHVTLKFIGEAAPERLEAIRDTLSRVHSDAAIDLKCRGLGFFPNEKRPQVLWVGLDAPASLGQLAEDVDRALEGVGIARERRAFAAHLTIARFDQPRLAEPLSAAIGSASRREFGAFQAREFHLIESKTKSTGAEYTRLATFPFAAEA